MRMRMRMRHRERHTYSINPEGRELFHSPLVFRFCKYSELWHPFRFEHSSVSQDYIDRFVLPGFVKHLGCKTWGWGFAFTCRIANRLFGSSPLK